MSLMISISGIRGIVGSTLIPEVIVQYVSAYAEYCHRGHIVIGRDGRSTGLNISQIVSSTLLQMGCDVTDLGVCPTPTVALAIMKFHAAGGIAITASHNPMIWNGLKFFSSTGLFLDENENKTFWSIAEKLLQKYVPWNGQGHYSLQNNFIEHHISCVLNLPFIDPQSIGKRKLKIVVDAINSAGGIIVPQLLKKLGCTVIEQNCDVSGVFSHTPEPIPENLTDLCEAVVREKADLGIAVDPDVDRLVLIDEKGKPFGEEYTIVTCTDFILSKINQIAKSKTVVVNLSTTRAVDDIAKKYGAKVVRTPVGEINVAKKMKELGAVIGGEGSGGVILPDVHLGRDAIVGIVLILQYVAESGKTLSALRASLPQYVIVKNKVELGSINPNVILDKIAHLHKQDGMINTDDGLKIDFARSWVHLRKSNTEPIIRIIAEAPTELESVNLVNKFTNEITS